MSSHKIKLFHDSFLEMFFIAISSNMQDYKFIHHLNKDLKANFVKLPDLTYYETEHKQSNHSLYHQLLNDLKANAFIIKNKSLENKFLIPQLKTTDYILIIDSIVCDDYKNQFLQSLEDISAIFIATEIDVTKIKKIEQIIEDLELSLMDEPTNDNQVYWKSRFDV